MNLMDGIRRLVDDGVATYRQLDYWCRTHKIELERGANGSGSRRLVSLDEERGIRLVASAYELIDFIRHAINTGDVFRHGATTDDNLDDLLFDVISFAPQFNKEHLDASPPA